MWNKNDDKMALYRQWYMPLTIAAIIHPEDTEPDQGNAVVTWYNQINYEQIRHSYGTAVHYVSSR